MSADKDGTDQNGGDEPDRRDERTDSDAPANRRQRRAEASASRKGGRGGAAREPEPEAGSAGAVAPRSADDEDADRFIAEVTEELRRDRLYALFRRYGPYAAAVIVAIVGVAAFNEYRAAQDTSAARAAGAAMIGAEAADEPSAAFLSAAAEIDGPAAALARFEAAARRQQEGDAAGAAQIYEGVAVDQSLPPRLRELAALKTVMAEFEIAEADVLLGDLTPLAAPGGAFRALALELRGLVELRRGDVSAARATFDEILALPPAERPQNVAERATAMLETLPPTGDEAETSAN